jgi:hypothetical protein
LVRVKSDDGYFHELPYTWEEERDFYRAMADGPKTVVHAPRPAPKTEEPKSPTPADRRKITTRANALNSRGVAKAR